MTARPLLDALRTRAADEAAASRAAAAAEVERIHAAAQATAERGAAAAMARANADVARERSLTEAAAAQRSRERTLPARAAAIERIFARARDRIEARATRPDFPQALDALVRDALTYLPDEGVRVRCRPDIAVHVSRAVRAAGRPDATVIGDPSVPLGVVAESRDGRVSVDATFVRRLERDRATFAARLAGALATEVR